MNRFVQSTDTDQPAPSALELDLSVVIPAYNEQRWLQGTVEHVLEYLRKRQLSFEVIIVNDGSRDQTQEIADGLAAKNPEVRVLGDGVNHGKGHAVRTGVLAAKGGRILMDDADSSTAIEELERLEAFDLLDYPIIIGSRAMKSAETTLEARWYRKYLGRIFNFLKLLILWLDYRDTQCGFKLFRRDAALFLFKLQKVDRFAFDVELLYLAKKFGYSVKETAVNWCHKEDSDVNLLIDPFSMIWDMLKIRWRDFRGAYRLKI